MRMLFLDCETFGQNANDCAVIDFSFGIVDTEKMISNDPYTCRSITDIKRFKLSVKDQVDKYGYVVYTDGIEFWKKQNEEVQSLIKPKSTDLTLEQFGLELITYLSDKGKIDRWWSRSSSFDPIIIWRLMESVKRQLSFNEYLPHWKQRDIRTYIDAKLDFPIKNAFIPIQDEDFWIKVFKEHDSSWDVLADILRMQAIYRGENDLEQINR